ncbi:hypothetical protein DF016_37470 [Burkholderia stagnalis]|nr:hypothetical protein DF016_37470 [Burkholderia stagnalis]
MRGGASRRVARAWRVLGVGLRVDFVLCSGLIAKPSPSHRASSPSRRRILAAASIGHACVADSV